MKPKSYTGTTKCSSKITHSTVKQQKQGTASPTKCRSSAKEVANPDLVNRFYTQQQKSVENNQQTVEGLRATSTAMQGDITVHLDRTDEMHKNPEE